MEKRKRSVKKAKASEGKETCWFYQGKCLTEAPEGHFGFIYKITNLLDGRIYIGKKQFTFRKKTRLSKKARAGTRKRVSVGRVDSGWQNYWSSCLALKADVLKLGKENFKREILCFCNSKAELSYYEVVEQILNAVMYVPSYNGWISCKIYKSKL